MKLIVSQNVIGTTVVRKTEYIITVPPDYAYDKLSPEAFLAQGEIIAGSGFHTYTRVPAGSKNRMVLISDSNQTGGLIFRSLTFDDIAGTNANVDYWKRNAFG